MNLTEVMSSARAQIAEAFASPGDRQWQQVAKVHWVDIHDRAKIFGGDHSKAIVDVVRTYFRIGVAAMVGDQLALPGAPIIRMRANEKDQQPNVIEVTLLIPSRAVETRIVPNMMDERDRIRTAVLEACRRLDHLSPGPAAAIEIEHIKQAVR